MFKRRRPRHSALFVAFEFSLGAALLGGAALAGIAFVHRPWPNRLDAAGFSLLAANPNSRVFRDIADIGSFRAFAIGIVVALLASVGRDWARFAACAVGPLAAVVITERIAKPLVGRHLAVLGGDSFPSGTVTAATALVVVVFLCAPNLLRPVVGFVGAVAVIAVSVAVVGMRWHYPTDAIGGICVGSGSVLLFDALFHVPEVLHSQLTKTGRTSQHSAQRDRTLVDA